MTAAINRLSTPVLILLCLLPALLVGGVTYALVEQHYTRAAESRYTNALAGSGVRGDGDWDELIDAGYDMCETQGDDAKLSAGAKYGLNGYATGIVEYAAAEYLC